MFFEVFGKLTERRMDMENDLLDLLPPDWKEYKVGEGCFDPAILSAYFKLREMFPDLYVNFRGGVRVNSWCGYRTPSCKIGASNSAHKRGMALDLHCGDMAGLRDFCHSSSGLKLGIKRIEDFAATPTWVHIDTAPPNEARWDDRSKPYMFKP